MTHPDMTIAYAAYTEGCTFLLDEQGVCRRALPKRGRFDDRTFAGRTMSEAARRCIGAQYVASIDVRVAGGLVAKPCVGAAMLFAYAGEDGRLAVVRTGPLVRFEDLTGERDTPAVPEVDGSERDTDSGVRELPDVTADVDEELLTVPLRHSDERPTPTAPMAWAAPALAPPPWTASSPPRHVTLQRVIVLQPGESAPTLERQPPGPGMLPRRRA